VDILMKLSARFHEAPETGSDISGIDVANRGRHAATVRIGVQAGHLASDAKTDVVGPIDVRFDPQQPCTP